LHDFRDLKLEVDAIRTADSSSLVKLGNTSLVCGCTTQIIKPKVGSNEPDDLVNIKIELPPICSGPTGYRAQNTAHILTKTLKNILNDTDCLDRSNLHIEQLDSYWSIDVEIVCLNYDGSLIDASLVAMLAALKTLKLKSNLVHEERYFSIKCNPVCSSFAIIGENFVCDPNLEEETIAQSIFNITTDPSNINLCHIIKPGGKAINMAKLKSCIEYSRSRAMRVFDCLDQKTNDTTKMDCA